MSVLIETESFTTAILFFAYVRNVVLIGAAGENFDLERAVIIQTLKKLGIPIGESSRGAGGVGLWGTTATEDDGAVVCGFDESVLPNGTTSGALKDAIERELNNAGYRRKE